MFIWDFVLGSVMDEFIDWIYGQVVGFLGDFFAQMGNMGVELFEMGWVQSIVLFFHYLGWSLYVVGIVVAVFEMGTEYQSGRGSPKTVLMGAFKGFMAVSLFTILPVELFKLSVDLQASLTAGITGYGTDFGSQASLFLTDSGNSFSAIGNPILSIFLIIMMGYAVIKVFFSNLKRGGILLIQIAVGSLHMFAVPRGVMDGFTSWMRQVIGLCLTTFLQATILTAGLMVVKDNALLGLGLMLSAGEIPRICGAFGLDTTTKSNVMGAMYATQAAVNTTRTIINAVPK